MLWRCNWVKPSKKILNALSFSSLHTQPRGVSPNPSLTHDSVYSRLQQSPPNLKTLNFFFWCATHPNYFHDARAFEHMATVVLKLTHDYDGIDRIILGLKQLGCVIKPRVYLLLLEIFWRGHLYDKAIQVFNTIKRVGYVPNTRTMNMMMDVNFKCNHVRTAIEIFNQLLVRNFFTFDIALSHFCSRGELVCVKDVLKIMIGDGFYPNSERFGQILGVFCRKGRIAQGFQVLGLMICSGVSVSVHVWSMLVFGFFRSGEPEKAIDMFHKMVQMGCSPNLVTYTSFIKGFMDLGRVDEALNVLNKIQSEGLAPDIVFSNLKIHTYTKLGRFEDARKVCTSLKETKLVADGYTFASMASSLCKSGNFDLLTSIAHGIETELDLVSGNALLNFFCKVGKNNKAMRLFSYLSSRDFVDCYTLSGYFTVLCQGGIPGEAVNRYRRMLSNKEICLDASVHTALIDSLIECRNYNDAIRLFNQCILQKYPLDVVSYTVAIKGLVRAKRIDEACSLLSKMKEAGVFPNRRTYRTIISGLCEEKENEKLKKILRECIEEGVQLDLNTKIKVSSLLSRYRRDASEFKQDFEKWKDEFDVYDSCDDELFVSVG